MNQYEEILELLADLKDIEESKLPIWATDTTRNIILSDMKEEYEIRKNIIINILQKGKYGDLTK